MDSELLNLVPQNIFGWTDNSTVSVPAAIFFYIVKNKINTCAIISIFFITGSTMSEQRTKQKKIGTLYG